MRNKREREREREREQTACQTQGILGKILGITKNMLYLVHRIEIYYHFKDLSRFFGFCAGQRHFLFKTLISAKTNKNSSRKDAKNAKKGAQSAICASSSFFSWNLMIKKSMKGSTDLLISHSSPRSLRLGVSSFSNFLKKPGPQATAQGKLPGNREDAPPSERAFCLNRCERPILR